MEFWLSTRGQLMKKKNILAGNATIKYHQTVILLNIKRQYIKESDTLADSATIKQIQKEILLSPNLSTFRS